MGANILGWVEVSEPALYENPDKADWYAVIDAGLLLDRNYNAFGSLFGVRNESGFMPVAPERGLPDNVSETVKHEATLPEDSDEDAWITCHSHSWLTWRETQQIDWNESVTDAWVHRYARRKHSGEIYSVGAYLPTEPHGRQAGESWWEGSTLLRVERVSRREALGESFEMLFELMAVLAKRYGADNVRLVVWFDG